PMRLRPHTSTLFPYTTLFRSDLLDQRVGGREEQVHLRPLDLSFFPLEPRDQVLGRVRDVDDAREAQRRRATLHRVHAPEDRVPRSEEHTSELQSLAYLVCRLL